MVALKTRVSVVLIALPKMGCDKSISRKIALEIEVGNWRYEEND